VSASAPTRCRSCGRETTTTDDGRCDYCGQPKLLADEPVTTFADRGPEDIPAATPARAAPSTWEALRPQLAAAALSAVIVVVGLLMSSELLLIAAALVLVIAVAAAVIDDGW
jgi:hypothetical protein